MGPSSFNCRAIDVLLVSNQASFRVRLAGTLRDAASASKISRRPRTYPMRWTCGYGPGW